MGLLSDYFKEQGPLSTRSLASLVAPKRPGSLSSPAPHNCAPPSPLHPSAPAGSVFSHMVRLPPQPGLSWVPIRHKVNPQATGAQVVPGSSRSSQVGPAPTSRRVLHHFCLVSALSKEGVVVILIRKKDQQQVKILWEAQWEGVCVIF